MKRLMIVLACLGLAVALWSQAPVGDAQTKLSWLGNANAIPGHGLVASHDLTKRNLLAYPEELAQAGWAQNQVTVAGTKVAETNDAASQHMVAQHSVSLASGATYTYYVDAQAAERTWLYLTSNGTGAWVGAYFNLQTGVLGTVEGGLSATISPQSGGVYRCAVTFTAGASSASFQVNIASANGTYAYDGILGNGINVYRTQLSLGPLPLPYRDNEPYPALNKVRNLVPNAAASTDLQLGSAEGSDGNDPVVGTAGLVFDGVDDYALLPASASPVLSDFTIIAVVNPVAENSVIAGRWDQTDGERSYALSISTAPVKAVVWKSSDGSAEVDSHASSANVPLSSWSMIAATKSGAAGSIHLNNALDASFAYSSSTVFVPTVAEFRVGRDYSGGIGGYFNGTISYVAIYNRALSDAEIKLAYRVLQRSLARQNITLASNQSWEQYWAASPALRMMAFLARPGEGL